MAWFRPMGVDEVAYHRSTVLDREDDHPGRALAYYGSRGETPLRWGGAGAARLGLCGVVTAEAYEAAFGPGGFADATTGVRLACTRRPGFELVVAAHKSVAVLGVVGEAEAMHSILDAETAGTMGWLDGWFQARGGRRGREQTRTPTGGLTYAVTRHATSRAGDPAPHDHVLVANVVEMLDGGGSCKALDSAALRDTVEAATMVGRLHSAWVAVQAGFRIEPDDGPSGRLRHWRIAGVPGEVCDLFSKRSDEIADHLEGRRGTYRERGIAARASRQAKRHEAPDDLLAGWRAELSALGWPVERVRDGLAGTLPSPATDPGRIPDAAIDQLIGRVLDVEGPLVRNRKVFTRTNLIAELAPLLYGQHPALLDRAVARALASRDVVPLVGLTGAREQAYTTTAVLEAELCIAQTAEWLAYQDGPSAPAVLVEESIREQERELDRELTAGQRNAVRAPA